MAFQHKVALFGAGLLALSAGVQAAPDWSKVPKRTIQVFHPGVTPIEWIVSKGDHGGSNGLRKGESCAGCHEDAGDINLDFDRLTKAPLEPVGGPSTKMFPVDVQAAYDAGNLYLRLSFKAPGAGANKGDPDHAMKVTVLFPNDKVKQQAQVGCWATCHTGLRTMPGGDDKKTKYTDEGAYDLMQWASKDNKVSDGNIVKERKMSGGSLGAKAEASEAGGVHTITFTRSNPGEGKVVPFGFAIHADHAAGRFHHVSLGYLLGIGAEGDLKAVKQ